jgi:hydroxyacylglutathione hydrolase
MGYIYENVGRTIRLAILAMVVRFATFMGMLKYQTIPSGQLQCNGTLIWDTDSKAAVLIDPTDDPTPFLHFIEAENLQVKALLLTHGHVDHAASVCRVAKLLQVNPQMHPADMFIYRGIPSHGAMYGIFVEPMDVEPTPLAHNQILEIAPGFQIQVLHTPGDTLFRESVGRTDLPGGNYQALVDSLRNVVYQLPPETIALPGHGPKTSIGHEMKRNAFVRAE